jgi:hypothetical protein
MIVHKLSNNDGCSRNLLHVYIDTFSILLENESQLYILPVVESNCVRFCCIITSSVSKYCLKYKSRGVLAFIFQTTFLHLGGFYARKSQTQTLFFKWTSSQYRNCPHSPICTFLLDLWDRWLFVTCRKHRLKKWANKYSRPAKGGISCQGEVSILCRPVTSFVIPISTTLI